MSTSRRPTSKAARARENVLVVTQEEADRLARTHGTKSMLALTPRQRDAIIRTEHIIGVGGGKFSGKTYLGIIWLISGNKHLDSCGYRRGAPCDCPYPDHNVDGTPIMVNRSYAYHPKFLGCVLRKNLVDLRDWIREARLLYEPMGWEFKEGEKTFVYPSTGAQIFCAHYDEEDAFTKFAGLNIVRFLVEEATHIPNVKRRIQMLRSCNRAVVGSGMVAQMMLTFNPGGVSHGDILDMFVKPKDENGDIIPPGTTITEEYDAREIYDRLGVEKPPEIGDKIVSRRVFIFSTIKDNPNALANADYIAALMDLPEEEREAYLFGNWDILAGEYFKSFRPAGPQRGEPPEANHVVPQNLAIARLQPWWWATGAIDWGYSHECAFGLAFHDQERDQLWITDEMVVSETEPDVVGEEIARRIKPVLKRYQEFGQDPMLSIGLSHDAYGLRQDDRSVAELIARGMSRILGPELVHAPDLLIDKLRDQMSGDNQSIKTQEADDMFERIRSQKRMGITLRRMRDSRIVGWQLVRSLMRWKNTLPAVTDLFDPNMASQIAFERGMEAYNKYLAVFQQKREILPKLQIVGPPAVCPKCNDHRVVTTPDSLHLVRCTNCGHECHVGQLRPVHGTGLGCSRLITAIPKAIRDELNPEDVTKKHVDGASDLWDMCLVADTLVETNRGGIPISTVSIGDLVLTRSGWCRVNDARMTDESAELFTVCFNDGNYLTGTRNHPIYANGEFTRLDSLRYGDIIETCQMSSFSMELSTDGIQTQSGVNTESITGQAMETERNLESHLSIGKSIKQPTDQFLSARSFTTKTITHSTTASTILPQEHMNNISETTGMNQEKNECGRFLQLELKPQKHGILPQRAVHGIAKMLNKLIALWCRLTLSVPGARQSLRAHSGGPSSAQITASLLRAGIPNQTTKSESVQSAESHSNVISTSQQKPAPVSVALVYRSGRGTVYNLSVNGAEEYYANGVLVHNCRYLCMTFRGQSMPEPFEALRRRRIAEVRAKNPMVDTNDLVHLNRKLENDWKNRNNGGKPINVVRAGRALRAQTHGLLLPPRR